jgi:hypothetical protein
MNHRRAGVLVVVCACLAGLSGVGAQSQKPGAKPSAKPKATLCDTLLTKDEVVGIVGADFAGPAFREPRPGFSSCEWQASEANFGFTFSSLRVLKVEQQTAEQNFDISLQAVEDD